MFNNSQFITSIVSIKNTPNKDSLPEFVFIGRSNVGKSSLVNSLCNKKTLAHISSKPGKTATINFFLIDEKLYFVDVPGYGYAAKSQQTRADYGTYIEEYLTKSTSLKIVFLLVDTKVGPTKDDITMYEYLKYLNLQVVIIATKNDKVGKTLKPRHLKNIKDKLQTKEVISTSSNTKEGLLELENLIRSHLA